MGTIKEDKNYYTEGSVELATETPLTVQRLEPVRSRTVMSRNTVLRMFSSSALDYVVNSCAYGSQLHCTCYNFKKRNSHTFLRFIH
jgi:hypothetical protein